MFSWPVQFGKNNQIYGRQFRNRHVTATRKFYENSDVRRRMIACVANFDLRETIFRPKMFAWHVRPGKNDPFLYLVLCSN